MKRAAFTLLEVVLALALAVVVIALLGTAVNLHLRVGDSSRYEVEQAQLARTLLQRIGDDIRNATPYTQSSGSANSSGSQMGSGSAQSSQVTAISDISSGSDGATDSSTTDSSDESQLSTPVGMSTAGGICGDGQNLQVEICRKPRLDRTQLAALSGDTAAAVVPQGETRNVTYYVAAPGDLGNADSGTGEPQCGLVRRDLQSAVFNFAMQQGSSSDLDQAIEVLAPEVEAIQFTYLDGGMTYELWDSSQQGKLPTAVRISLSLRRPELKTSSLMAASPEDTPAAIYDLVVYLPNSQAVQNQAAKQSSSGASQAKSQPKEIKSADSIMERQGPAMGSSNNNQQQTKQSGAGKVQESPLKMQSSPLDSNNSGQRQKTK